MENPIKMDDLGVPLFRKHPVGGLKDFLFSPLFGEGFQFDSYFFRWVETTNQNFESVGSGEL